MSCLAVCLSVCLFEPPGRYLCTTLYNPPMCVCLSAPPQGHLHTTGLENIKGIWALGSQMTDRVVVNNPPPYVRLSVIKREGLTATTREGMPTLIYFHPHLSAKTCIILKERYHMCRKQCLYYSLIRCKRKSNSCRHVSVLLAKFTAT